MAEAVRSKELTFVKSQNLCSRLANLDYQFDEFYLQWKKLVPYSVQGITWAAHTVRATDKQVSGILCYLYLILCIYLYIRNERVNVEHCGSFNPAVTGSSASKFHQESLAQPIYRF